MIPPVHDGSNADLANLAQLMRVDKICDAYERAWIEGQTPRLEDFFALGTATDRDTLRRELELIQRDYQGRGRQLGIDSDRMQPPPVSLLMRLFEPSPKAAWQRFVDLYSPLIFHWGRRQGLNALNASDLVQEVLADLIIKLPEIQQNPNRQFRDWLRKAALNKARALQLRESTQPRTSQEPESKIATGDEADPFEEAEYRKFIFRRALELMQSDFPETSWKACWNQIVHGRTAAEVAEELGISRNAAHVAKCRVLKRLREELADLMD